MQIIKSLLEDLNQKQLLTYKTCNMEHCEKKFHQYGLLSMIPHDSPWRKELNHQMVLSVFKL